MARVPVTSALSKTRKMPVIEQDRLTMHCSEGGHTPGGIMRHLSQRMLERTWKIWVLVRRGFGEGLRKQKFTLDLVLSGRGAIL